MFLCAGKGHSGPTSSFPCLFCEIPKDDLRKGATSGHKQRTAESIEEGGHSIDKKPLIGIDIDYIVPSSLHTIMGAVQGIYDELKNEAEQLNKVRELENACKKLGADQQAWFQSFNGMLVVYFFLYCNFRQSLSKVAHRRRADDPHGIPW